MPRRRCESGAAGWPEVGQVNNALMFSSKSDEWATPQDLFDKLHAEFDFGVDLAASAENHKLPKYYSRDGIDALE